MRARGGRRTAEPSCKLPRPRPSGDSRGPRRWSAKHWIRATTSRPAAVASATTAPRPMAELKLSAVRSRHPPAIGERQARCRQVEPRRRSRPRQRVDRSELAGAVRRARSQRGRDIWTGRAGRLAGHVEVVYRVARVGTASVYDLVPNPASILRVVAFETVAVRVVFDRDRAERERGVEFGSRGPRTRRPRRRATSRRPGAPAAGARGVAAVITLVVVGAQASAAVPSCRSQSGSESRMWPSASAASKGVRERPYIAGDAGERSAGHRASPPPAPAGPERAFASTPVRKSNFRRVGVRSA